MELEPGRDKTGGRIKGTPNKFTNLKQAFLDAFELIGGVEGLAKWGEKDRNKRHFYSMIAKMLPKDIVVDMDVDGKLIIERRIIQGNGKDET